MFDFTGVARWRRSATNRFLDGADRRPPDLVGGALSAAPDERARVAHAGATGSYGTQRAVQLPRQVPRGRRRHGHYLAGETLIEAYWKSVRMPGQGVFVGDPLARPFGGVRSRVVGTTVQARIHARAPAAIAWRRRARLRPFRTVATLQFDRFGPQTLRLPATPAQVYRLVPETVGRNSASVTVADLRRALRRPAAACRRDAASRARAAPAQGLDRAHVAEAGQHRACDVRQIRLETIQYLACRQRRARAAEQANRQPSVRYAAIGTRSANSASNSACTLGMRRASASRRRGSSAAQLPSPHQ